MKKIIVNLSLVSKILIVDKKENTTYTRWSDGYVKKIFGFVWDEEKAGFHGWHPYLGYLTLEEIKKNYIVENNILYNKPYVKFFVGDDCILCEEFNTFEEALKFGKEMTKGMPEKLEVSRQ